MINRLQLLRNVGAFDNVAAGANLSFGRLTVIYAENGKGKTTLSALFRSLATGEAIHVVERRRLGAQHPPHIRIECAAGAAVFENNAWNRAIPSVTVFDDIFVDQNIHSGLAVDPSHRQHLHEFILGSQGVVLNRRLQTLIAENERLNTEKRAREADIAPTIRGPYNVDEFCELQQNPQIESLIQEATRALAAAKEQEPIRLRPLFNTISLPEISADDIESVLRRDLPGLDADAAERVQAHLERLGTGGESWVSEGMGRLTVTSAVAEQPCPFCAQALHDSPVINHYRAYFSEAYTNLKRSVSEMRQAIIRAHGGDVQGTFERAVRVTGENRAFWSRYCEVPNIALDTETIARDWRNARELILAILYAKQAAPLEPATLGDETRIAINVYAQHRETVVALSEQLQTANTRINTVKAQAAAGNVPQLTNELTRLRAIQARYLPANVALCNAYMQIRNEKIRNDQEREASRTALEQYRAASFPAMQGAVNAYLERFGAGFGLANVEAANVRGGSVCNYSVVINNNSVNIAGGQPPTGEPSFRNTLSAGDRNTLTLAFFLASLDRDPDLAHKIVVIDDPFSSLDDHRGTATIHEIRQFVSRVAQVVVLSHNKRFLASLWENTDRNQRAALQVVRHGNGSTFVAWDVSADEFEEHDRRHQRLRNYLDAVAGQNLHSIAQDLRPTLEKFLRVAYPDEFPPGTLIGLFVTMCERRLAAGDALLSTADTRELKELNYYTSQFHHDSNQMYNVNLQINDGELRRFVERVLRFTRRA